MNEIIIAVVSSLTTLLVTWIKIRYDKKSEEREEKSVKQRAETLIENLNAEKIVFIRKGKAEFEIEAKASTRNEKIFPVRDKEGVELGELKIVFSNKKDLSERDEEIILEYLKLLCKTSKK